MGKYCDEKRGRRQDERGREERAEEERNCTARVSYRVITILGHFHPSPLSIVTGFLPFHPPRPTLSPSATSSDIKLFIVHNGASSFVKSKKKKKAKYIYKWRKTGGERERPCLRAEKGCFVKFVDLPRRSLPPAVPPPRRFFLVFPFFLLRRTWKHDRRAIDPKTL